MHHVFQYPQLRTIAVLQEYFEAAVLVKVSQGEGPAILKVTPPEREFDGKRCHVHFAPVPAAVKYDADDCDSRWPG